MYRYCFHLYTFSGVTSAGKIACAREIFQKCVSRLCFGISFIFCVAFKLKANNIGHTVQSWLLLLKVYCGVKIAYASKCRTRRTEEAAAFNVILTRQTVRTK